MKAAATSYAKKSGNTVTVEVAKDMNQQLAKQAAAGSPTRTRRR